MTYRQAYHRGEARRRTSDNPHARRDEETSDSTTQTSNVAEQWIAGAPHPSTRSSEHWIVQQYCVGGTSIINSSVVYLLLSWGG